MREMREKERKGEGEGELALVRGGVGMGIAGGARASSELMDDDAADMIGEGEEWNLQLREGKGRVLERKGLKMRFRVWLKFKDFNVCIDEDITDVFIFVLFLETDFLLSFVLQAISYQELWALSLLGHIRNYPFFF